MYKPIQFLNIQILTVGFLLIFISCDLTGETEANEVIEPGFSYDIIDENGVTLNKVTHQKVDGIEVETSLGLFGDKFFPFEMREAVSEQFGLDPDLFKRNEIILHAEKGIEGDVHFASLKFTLPQSVPFHTNTFQISSLTEEQWLNMLRIMWEMRREHRSEKSISENLLANNTIAGSADERVSISYYEFGFGLQDTMFMYISTGGELELENVTDEFVSGKFFVDLTGLPMDIFDAKEFPETPDVHRVRIIGDFIAEPGDFNDLKQIRFDLLRETGVPFIPLF